MSLQSEYLMSSELEFGFKEHSSTIMCSTLLVETVEYYESNNFKFLISLYMYIYIVLRIVCVFSPNLFALATPYLNV